MQRRGFCGLLGSGFLLSACAGASSPLTSYVLSMAQLQAALAGKFPRSYPLAGLLDLQLQMPQLRLLAQSNRIGARMALQATGPLLAQARNGSLDVDFALRYEAADHSIRASQLQVKQLQIDGLSARLAALLNDYGSQLAEKSLQDVALHQLRPADVAKLDRLGVRPGAISVLPHGVSVGLVPQSAAAL